MLAGKRIALIITGGIAAYKSLDLIRRLQERGAKVRAIMTEGACQFVTPLAVGALTGDQVFTKLFDRAAEHDVGHIRLSREADLIVVAPATANTMAKLANGLADNLATCVLLATDKPVLMAPAMNSRMWAHPATQRNLAQLQADGVRFVGPSAGEMAEKNEAGVGRMAEPLEIVAAVEQHFANRSGALNGKHVLITAGPTHEPIDPVRYIANRSSGKQGYALAEAALKQGAEVTLISGPVGLQAPSGAKLIKVETAQQMQDAVNEALPADIAIMAAAVADWRTSANAQEKMKKDGTGSLPVLHLTENPDILRGIGHLRANRPQLVIGFAAETQNLLQNARSKLERKGADMIVANDVSAQHNVMGGDSNTVHLVTAGGVESLPKLSKQEAAERIISVIAKNLQPKTSS
ncbi:bifunctional phosphopantothenoylcysteine decarboxylase/phosphopantothenate--cysteine ligase CoaBC [Polycladidibacter hongkongensis]|uniref:bifunctional phosphopantothenoylcysteine decarboxylase/phosphopantothenate--cysteine ligase CoaBC n=1 Tax=Polycladidibacter hongkongensis TaxID=1647556 RepID=UPI00082A3D53|nr:bifunctional phosphopantothenoylcysteine decarboxylase/phosphopantothenate--cysteine ligase CoaBC [Pseudovibrio hongkongensis]